MENRVRATDICSTIGAQVTEWLNEAAGTTVASMGHELPDGTYEFVLGPVYMPHNEVTLAAPTQTVRLLANLRPETQKRAKPQPRQVKWMCKRGDGYVEEHGQPPQAIVIESIDMPLGEDLTVIQYRLSR